MTHVPGGKVIFLDIDGVLNFHQPESPDQSKTIQRELLGRLRAILEATGAKIVLASTWRHEEGAVDEARSDGVPIDDVLPDLRPASRGKEIISWLNKHPEVQRYLVLDDEDDDYGGHPLFQPQAGEGLQQHLADEMIQFLNGKSDHQGNRNWLVRTAQRVWLAATGHRG
jgi:hypothetical protein